MALNFIISVTKLEWKHTFNFLFPLFLRLEKEYTTIKTKEMEEQVEIKVSILELLKVLNITWLKSVIWQYMLGYVTYVDIL